MKQSILRRCAALAVLLAFCMLTGMCAFADDQGEDPNYVRIAVPASASADVRLTGPDVDEDGSLVLQEGKNVQFTLEGPLTTDFNALSFHFIVSRLVDGRQAIWFPDRQLLLHADENGALFGAPADGEAGRLSIVFENANVSVVTKDPNSQTPDFVLDGTFQIEVRVPVSKTVERPVFDSSDAYETETERLLNGVAASAAPFDELVFRATVRGQSGSGRTTDFAAEEFAFSFSTLTGYAENLWDAELEYNGQVQPVDVGQDSAWGYQTLAMMNITDWGHAATGGGSVVATATGATALGLGGSAVANALAQPDALPARRRDEELSTEEPEETPDLPEEDSPEVSLSLYKPFGDLVNTKGAAVDIQITVNGGEGLRWHYLPTAICPGGLKAVVPTVVGTGSESTLVLGLTGAAMKQAHCPVFVTVVAWAVGTNGKTLKTSGTMEVMLHRGGLEAKRNEDGRLEVISYQDGNLDGLAERRVLKESEYTVAEHEDGTVRIQAKEKRLGGCTLESGKENG